MQARAYVLIEAEAGTVAGVLETLRGMQVIAAADAVTGPYDIIALVETPDNREIGRIVMHDIQPISGVKRTITCLAIG